eukprot:2843340-Alexandrium_andersonii.AAC.1
MCIRDSCSVSGSNTEYARPTSLCRVMGNATSAPICNWFAESRSDASGIPGFPGQPFGHEALACRGGLGARQGLT